MALVNNRIATELAEDLAKSKGLTQPTETIMRAIQDFFETNPTAAKTAAANKKNIPALKQAILDSPEGTSAVTKKLPQTPRNTKGVIEEGPSSTPSSPSAEEPFSASAQVTGRELDPGKAPVPFFDQNRLPATQGERGVAVRGAQGQYIPPENRLALPPAPETQDTTAYTKYPGTDSLENGQGYSVQEPESLMDKLRPYAKTAAPAATVAGLAAGAGIPGTPGTPGAEEEKAPELPTTIKSAIQKKQEAPVPTLPKEQIPYAEGRGPVKEDKIPQEKKKVAGVTVPTAPKPTDLEKILSTFESKIEKSQAGVKSAMNTQLSELKDLETVYRNEAKAAKDQVAKQELAENMGHALAQFGAGLQGLKTGIDMSSGLKFNKTDWNKRYEQAIEELKANLTDLREKRGEVKAMGLEGMKEAERRGERGMTLEAGELARKEAAKSAAGLETRKETFQTKERSADRKSREAIAGIQAASRQSALNQKLNEKQAAAVDEATNNLLEDYQTIQTSDDKEAKKLAIKNYEKHKQVLNAYLGDSGKTVGAIEAKLKDVPFFSTTSGYLEEQVPEQAGVLQKAVSGRAPAKAAVPGVAAGQAPAAGGTIQVRDATQGSPTFGQTKAVKNSDKVQQLIREGKLQAVQ